MGIHVMSKKQTKESTVIYQLKIVLRGVHPPVLRVLQIRGDASLGKLHDYLQGVMGWTDSHLHEFKIKGERYRDAEQMYEDSIEPDMYDEKKHTLSKLLKEGDTFEYEYDFGDCWEHDILVEKIIPPQEGIYYPLCLYGERSCPPEDCGGPWGYEDLLNIIKNPTHEDHKQYSEWAGKGFDPVKFDIAKTNWTLDKIKSNLREPRGDWAM